MEHEQPKSSRLNPETRRGILVVILLTSAILFLLSFFGIAGSVGETLDGLLRMLFGWDRYLLPIFFITIGGIALFPERATFSTFNYLGALGFFLSFNSVLNHTLLHTNNPVVYDVASAGGYIGEALASTLPPFLGWMGSLLVLLALLVVSILLLFNTSLRSLFSAHAYVRNGLSFFSHIFRRKQTSNLMEESLEDTRFAQEDIIHGMDDEEATFPQSPPIRVHSLADSTTQEKVLTTRQRRKVTIPMDLLELYKGKAASGDIARSQEIIMETFRQFGIDVEMGETTVGPTVTQYTMRPSQGVKVARIVSLQNDLALALAAHPIRIEAPIPGKSLVGIEVPNQKVATVSLRELLESNAFKTRTSNLSVPLGKDVSGKSWVVPIEKMPHLLVAGATGSGKSVCLNTIIISLLFENGPDDLKLILVDPKRVELTSYDGIPHLLIPPITKVDDTINALKWTVREMERRLDVLSKFGARDILSYNTRSSDKMPKIVVVIDELADLMSTNQREVESAIVRIAQLARATGIHLVLATQRPSVDVITGLIKANIPSRIAFSVASQTDSRTILDLSGAEKLLGRGDMLYSDATLSKPKRLQGAFVSESEVSSIVQFLKKESVPDYNYEVTQTSRNSSVFNTAQESEPLLDEAVHIVLQSGRASTSLLQRRLKIGYSRAARIMDIMEEQGIIGSSDGSKAREILIEEWPATEEIPTRSQGQDFSFIEPTNQTTGAVSTESDLVDDSEESWSVLSSSQESEDEEDFFMDEDENKKKNSTF